MRERCVCAQATEMLTWESFPTLVDVTIDHKQNEVLSMPIEHKNMAAKMPQKSIDDIKKITEMIKVFESLGIDCDEENANLKEMKTIAKEKIEEQRLNGTTVSVLHKFKLT